MCPPGSSSGSCGRWRHDRERDERERRRGELETAAREELVDLWADLHEAKRVAHDGQWSIGCAGLAERIKRLTLLVGPAPWEQIQIGLLEDGTYQRLHAAWGFKVTVDMARVAEVRATIDASRWRSGRYRASRMGG